MTDQDKTAAALDPRRFDWTFKFGIYAGKSIAHVAQHDPVWLIQFADDGKGGSGQFADAVREAAERVRGLPNKPVTRRTGGGSPAHRAGKHNHGRSAQRGDRFAQAARHPEDEINFQPLSSAQVREHVRRCLAAIDAAGAKA